MMRNCGSIFKNPESILVNKMLMQREKTKDARKMYATQLAYDMNIPFWDDDPKISFRMLIPIKQFGMGMHIPSFYQEEIHS